MTEPRYIAKPRKNKYFFVFDNDEQQQIGETADEYKHRILTPAIECVDKWADQQGWEVDKAKIRVVPSFKTFEIAAWMKQKPN